MLENGERQVSETLDGIRADHVARYRWAAKKLKPNSIVLDLACGIGYGSKILADAGHTVIAIDRSVEAIEFAKEYYGDPAITYVADDTGYIERYSDKRFDAVVCFETIEHIERPLPTLKKFCRIAPLLFASVPNEDKFPFRNYAFHFRHYRPYQFKDMIESAGYKINSWHGQEGPESDVEPDRMGRTIIVCAECGGAGTEPALVKPRFSLGTSPKHVSIVALGPSSQHYVEVVKGIGGRHAFCDEVWAINAHGNVLDCDLVVHMDDLYVQKIRADARPDGNIANMIEGLKRCRVPIITSIVDEDREAYPERAAFRDQFPTLKRFPLEEVINDFNSEYFNNTASYAVALAIHIKVEKITLWGMDYTLLNSHSAERGRANLEYWIGRAMERGIRIATTPKSTLLDACAPKRERLYGYDTVDVDIAEQPDRYLKVSFKPRDKLPTAEAVEKAYDHSAHPNAIVRGEVDA